MRYQQTSIVRLAKSGRKLINDGAWHQFAHEPRHFYRVVNRIVQRLAFEIEDEVIPLESAASFDPLPSKVFREGFREEITIRRDGDGWRIVDILFRAADGWEEVASIVSSRGVRLEAMNASTLRCDAPLADLQRDALITALLDIKACGIVLSELEAGEILSEHAPRHEIQSLFTRTIESIRESFVTPKIKPKRTNPFFQKKNDT